MKKFLCYDTNDAASGKINVNSNGVLNSNATVPSINGDASYKQLVTDGEGGVKWEDRLAYDDSVSITWDGDTSGRIVASVLPEKPDSKLVKISDMTNSMESFIGWTVKITDWDPFVISSNNIEAITEKAFSILVYGSNFLFVVGEDNTVIEYDEDMYTFPEKGIYTLFTPNDNAFVESLSYNSVKKINQKYIPSELNEVILPSSTSGSTKKFKITINDSGTISATEV